MLKSRRFYENFVKNRRTFGEEHPPGPIGYRLVRSARETIAIQVSLNGTVTVRAPKNCSDAVIRSFVQEKEKWIRKKQAELLDRAREREARQNEFPPLCQEEIRRYRGQAEQALRQKVELFARQMDVNYGRITIRDQKTRWGSCSAKGNLNFNWRLILAPENVMDYVVVHELAHRREMNHSPRFWALVESVLPDYKERRLWLKKNGDMLMCK